MTPPKDDRRWAVPISRRERERRWQEDVARAEAEAATLRIENERLKEIEGANILNKNALKWALEREATLRAQVEEMRRALERIAEEVKGPPTPGTATTYWRIVAQESAKIARAALATPKEPRT